MKIAIISDIHSNPIALLTVIADIEKQKCGRIVCLGDIVGYGYDPNACVDIIRDHNIECFMGNHDAGLVGILSIDCFNRFAYNSILRQRALVTADNKEWIRQLPYSSVEQDGFATPEEKKFKIAFAHGELMSPEEFNYINGYSDAALEFPSLEDAGVRVLFVGHTHYANVYTYAHDCHIGEWWIDVDYEEKKDLSKFKSTIVNVGSCGYPRNHPYIIYGIYIRGARKMPNL